MFAIAYGSAVTKDLKKLDKEVLMLVDGVFQKLSENPYAGEKLRGGFSEYFSYHFKVKKIEYRIIYKIKDEQLMVYVVMIGSRENLYDKLKRRI